MASIVGRFALILVLSAAALAQSPATTDSLLQAGITAMNMGDAQHAEAIFRSVLRANARSFEAHTYLGVLADRADRPVDAERHFAAAVSVAPRSPQGHNNLGAILLKLHRTRDAAAEFETSLRLDGKQQAALVNLGRIRAEEGTPASLKTAQDLFQRAQAISPDIDVARALVVVDARLDNQEATENAYRSYAQLLASAGPLERSSGRTELGEALLHAGLYDDAIQELNAALAVDAADVPAIVALAKVHEARHDLPAAGRTLESAVARGIQAGPIYSELADVYEATGHVANAIPAMRLAIDTEPKNEAYRFRYGMLLTDTKAPAAAAIRLKESLGLFPKSPRLWFALGVAYFSDNKNEDAAAAFARTIELDKDFAPAYVYLAMSQVDAGRYAQAVKLYEKALALHEDFAAAHYLAAEALLKLEPPEQAAAEKHLVRALALQPSMEQAHLELGKIYLRSKRVTEAAAELEQVVKDAPDLAEAHYQLGRAYQDLKRKDDSRTQFAEFERLQKEQREQTIAERQKLLHQLANVRF